MSQENQGRIEEQMVVFQLAGETYGLDIASVHEIIRIQPITAVPRTPEFIEGVINLRGRIVPVIDLHKRFDLIRGEASQSQRIMVVDLGGMTVGMIVDAVSEVLRLPLASIEPPPPVFSGVDVAYLRGVGKWNDQLIILLDLEKVLANDEYSQLEQGIEVS